MDFYINAYINSVNKFIYLKLNIFSANLVKNVTKKKQTIFSVKYAMIATEDKNKIILIAKFVNHVMKEMKRCI
jgi:hypothetical protein